MTNMCEYLRGNGKSAVRGMSKASIIWRSPIHGATRIPPAIIQFNRIYMYICAVRTIQLLGYPHDYGTRQMFQGHDRLQQILIS